MDREGQGSILQTWTYIELALAWKPRHTSAIPLLVCFHIGSIAFGMHQILGTVVLVRAALEISPSMGEAEPSLLPNNFRELSHCSIQFGSMAYATVNIMFMTFSDS